MEDFIIISHEQKMNNGRIIEKVFEEYQTFEDAARKMYSCPNNYVIKTSGVLFDVESNEIPHKLTFTNYISATAVANDCVTRLHLPDVKIYRRMWYAQDKRELISYEYKLKDNHVEIVNENTARINKAFVSNHVIYVQNKKEYKTPKAVCDEMYDEHVVPNDDSFTLYIVENDEAKSFEKYMIRRCKNIRKVTPKMFIDNIYLISYFFIEEAYESEITKGFVFY